MRNVRIFSQDVDEVDGGGGDDLLSRSLSSLAASPQQKQSMSQAESLKRLEGVAGDIEGQIRDLKRLKRLSMMSMGSAK